MKSLLHTLTDNEAVLLMYLFDELPADDRAEVEEMLLTDSALRAEFEQLKHTHAAVDDAMKRSDETLTSWRSEASVRRSTYGLFEQWNTRRLLKQAAAVERSPSKLRWVVYAGTAAVAALVAVTYVWVLNNDGQFHSLPGDPLIAMVSPSDGDSLASSFEDKESFEIGDGLSDARAIDSSDLLRKSFDTSEEVLNDSLVHVDLAAAERELHAIAVLSDSRTVNGDIDDQNQIQ